MKLNRAIISLQILLLAGMLSACGNDDTDKASARVKNEHFFMKEQVDAINKAKAVEGMMQEHVRQEMQEADAQSR
jgi:hypothetical protein